MNTTVYTKEIFIDDELLENKTDKQETLKRLYIGFSNKTKLESLRFFII